MLRLTRWKDILQPRPHQSPTPCDVRPTTRERRNQQRNDPRFFPLLVPTEKWSLHRFLFPVIILLELWPRFIRHCRHWLSRDKRGWRRSAYGVLSCVCVGVGLVRCCGYIILHRGPPPNWGTILSSLVARRAGYTATPLTIVPSRRERFLGRKCCRDAPIERR